jgi:hypothetical protein
MEQKVIPVLSETYRTNEETYLTTYLGNSTDIKYKIAAGSRCFRAFNKMPGTRYLSKNMKIRTYKTIIRPIILYGSETWTINGKMNSL